jgi:hypothetical protein
MLINTTYIHKLIMQVVPSYLVLVKCCNIGNYYIRKSILIKIYKSVNVLE